MEISGRRAVVLGGSSGIGLATVQQLVTAGAEVIAGSRSKANLEAATKALGGRADFREVDVLDREGLAVLFREAAPFDILVNAATGGERAVGPFLQMDLDGFQGSFRKLWGYVNSVRLGAEHLSDEGAIALVSGAPARRAGPGMSAISTVGNAVEGFVRAIARELAPRRINVVSPGTIDTAMFPMEGQARERFFETVTQGQPIPRPGRADEIADAIVFTLRNDYVTGATIDVEGGALL